jgi:hypothetical protein
MTRAAEAFDETLRELGLDQREFDDEEQFGRRAALLAASEFLWERELGPMASASQVGELLGCSRQAVNERVHRRTILALAAPTGYAFPLFQFTGSGQTVPGITGVIRALSDAVQTPHTIAAWLVAPEAELGGAVPIEMLKRGEPDSAVTTAAERYAERLRQ